MIAKNRRSRKQCCFCGRHYRSDTLARHIKLAHFHDKSKFIPKKMEDMELAHGEWVIKPYWSMERE